MTLRPHNCYLLERTVIAESQTECVRIPYCQQSDVEVSVSQAIQLSRPGFDLCTINLLLTIGS